MSRNRVIVESHFKKFGAELDRAAARGLGRGAAAVVAASRHNETRVRTGALRSSIKAGPIQQTRRGPTVPILTMVFYGRFQELGTLGRRRKKLKHPEKRTQSTTTASGATRGVKPLHFLAHGLRDAWPIAVKAISRELGRAR